MSNVKVDAANLMRKFKRLREQLPEAGMEALKGLMGGQGVMGLVVAECPTDTNRLLIGYSEAARQAELPPPAGGWPRLAIGPSKYTDRYIQRLTDQLESLEKKKDWIVASDRSWSTRKGARTGEMRPFAARHLKRVNTAIEKTRADLATIGVTDILMRGGDSRLRQYSLRQKIYGGEGRSWRVMGGVFVRIHNKEPHASTVDKMHRSFSTALTLMKSVGLVRVKKKFVKRLADAYQRA